MGVLKGEGTAPHCQARLTLQGAEATRLTRTRTPPPPPQQQDRPHTLAAPSERSDGGAIL